MSYTRHRPHLHNRRQTLRLAIETEPIDLWLPPVDEPIFIDNFGAAASIACWINDGPLTSQALILMDAHRQITAILLDPPASVTVFPGMIEGPGFEVDFCQTMIVMIVADDLQTAPSAEERTGFESIRKFHVLQGLYLLDVVQVNGDDLRSMSIAFDRHAAWFADRTPANGCDCHVSSELPVADHEAA